MKKRTYNLVLLVIMTIVFTLSSCASKNSSGKTEIQFMHSMVEQNRIDTIQNMIDNFQKENPDIVVSQSPVDEDSFKTKFISLAGSASLPAVVEMEQNFARLASQNQLIDYDAVKTALEEVGLDNYYNGPLNVTKSEDGNYTVVPIAGWIQGIWYDKAMFASKNLAPPTNYDNIMKAAQAFHDPANKKYGIALPTTNSAFTEQVFSQFALANNANIINENGNADFDKPAMKEALDFYRNLAKLSMPGSNDVTAVKDAFINKSVPMAIYSTWILSAIEEAGRSADLGFAVPAYKSKASFGNITGLGITSGLSEAEKVAAIKFAKFMSKEENNVQWILLSPAGLQPIMKNVASNTSYLENPTIKAFAATNKDITSAYDDLQVFGTLKGKNFNIVGDVIAKGIIGECLYNVIVQGADINSSVSKVQAQMLEIMKK